MSSPTQTVLLLAGRVGLCAFALGVFVDLASKAGAVVSDSGVIYHDGPSKMAFRILGCLVTVLCVATLTAYASEAGLGRQFGLWIGCGFAVAGIVSNGLSALLWSHGVPDFISVGAGWVWNVADFEIVVGTTLGLLSYVVAAVAAYVRTVRDGRG